MNFELVAMSTKRTTTWALAIKHPAARLAAGKATKVVKIEAFHDMEFDNRCEKRP